MPRNGPIVLVDENANNQTLICRAFGEIKIKNRIESCHSAEKALDFLEQMDEKPFLIITNTELPGISGLEFQRRILETEHLRERSIPFIFFSRSDSHDIVGKAYGMRAQGYFVMPKEFINIKLILFCITDYWQRAVHPSSVDSNFVDC